MIFTEPEPESGIRADVWVMNRLAKGPAFAAVQAWLQVRPLQRVQPSHNFFGSSWHTNTLILISNIIMSANSKTLSRHHHQHEQHEHLRDAQRYFDFLWDSHQYVSCSVRSAPISSVLYDLQHMFYVLFCSVIFRAICFHFLHNLQYPIQTEQQVLINHWRTIGQIYWTPCGSAHLISRVSKARSIKDSRDN